MITEHDLNHINDVRGLMLAALYDMDVIQQSPADIATGAHPTVEGPHFYISNAYQAAIKEYDRAKAMSDEEFLLLMQEEYNEAHTDIPNCIEGAHQFNRRMRKLKAELEGWYSSNFKLQELKFKILDDLDTLIYPEKLIQDFESILEKPFDGSPKAIDAFKKDYIDRRFRVLNAAEDSYKVAWSKYNQNKALLDAVLSAFPQEETT